MDLDGTIADSHRDLRREELRLRREAGHDLSGVLRQRRPFGEQPTGVDLGRHLREIEPDRLEVTNGLSELAALLRVLQRRLEGAARHSYGERRDPDAAAV